PDRHDHGQRSFHAARGVVLRPDQARCPASRQLQFQFVEQPEGWLGPIVQPNMPKLTNLRHDPFERMNWPGHSFAEGSVGYWDSFKHEMWRFQSRSTYPALSSIRQC